MSTHLPLPRAPFRARERPGAHRRTGIGLHLTLVACLAAVHVLPAAAQERPAGGTARPDSVARPHVVSPKGAFLRALVLPGWGHASIGSWNRGAFYFTAEAATAWELFRTRERLLEASARARFQEGVVRRDLVARGVTDPDSIRAKVNDDGSVKDLRGLVAARKTQQQDWLALGIFIVFLSGADAYVSANLQHFPAPISIDASPTGPVGRMQISVSVPVPHH